MVPPWMRPAQIRGRAGLLARPSRRQLRMLSTAAREVAEEYSVHPPRGEQNSSQRTLSGLCAKGAGLPDQVRLRISKKWTRTGESGPRARPSDPLSFLDPLNQCRHHEMPFHCKQWGEWAPIENHNACRDRF